MMPLWNELAEHAGRTLSPEQLARLDRYLDLLFEANQRMNLTAIRDRAAAELQHVADALTLLPLLPAGAHRLADVGSGGGVPGLPLAIARPDAAVVLVESVQKKARFLGETARALGLANVIVRAERAESVARSAARDSFDVVTARAVGDLALLVEWCLPLVRKGGSLLAQKGARLAEELPGAVGAIRKLSGGEPKVHPAGLPGLSDHVIVQIPKIGATNALYPREPSVAKRKPL